MPLWEPYDELLKSDLADFANASNSPMAGCITAALFLKKFVPDGHRRGRISIPMRGAMPPNRAVPRVAKRLD